MIGTEFIVKVNNINVFNRLVFSLKHDVIIGNGKIREIARALQISEVLFFILSFSSPNSIKNYLNCSLTQILILYIGGLRI